MQKFDHFYRFFTLSEDGKPFATNRLTPTERHAKMPVIGGDVLQFLVPRSDIPLDLAFARVDLKSVETGMSQTGIGSFRQQDGELCSRIRLRVNRAPKPGEIRQFALMGEIPDPLGENTLTVPVLGTFTGNQSTLESYLTAIREHYENYPYTPVSVDQYGNELLIRAYHGSRFRLGNQPLFVGLGRNRTYNENSPSLSAQKFATVNNPAKDSYLVSVGSDIEEGNIFTLGGTTHVAAARQTPTEILAALGVPASGRIETLPGAVPSYSATAGSVVLNNRNRPTLLIVFRSTSGGNDLYDVVAGADIQPGNVFQVAVPGLPTRTYVVQTGDTVTTVVNFFANTGGKLSVPTGSVPLLTTVPGFRTISNTNSPSLTLTNKEIIAAATVDRYNVYVGTSIRRGNIFILGSQTVIATDDDNALTIAEKLSYTGIPFVVEVPTGAELVAYAKRGNLLNESNIASVELVEGSVWMNSLPFVCRVSLPNDLPTGDYQLVLTDTRTDTPIAVSNYLAATDNGKDTVILRWGDDHPGSGRTVFGYEYGEPGFMQQVRIPAYLGEPKQIQQETLYTSIDSVLRRQSARFQLQRKLTTTLQPGSFHRSLLAALKHNSVEINGIPLLCEGEYAESEFIGVRQLLQGQAVLSELNSMRSTTEYFPLATLLRSALIESIDGALGLVFYLKSETATLKIDAGMQITPDRYQLIVRCESESHQLAVYSNDQLLSRFQLTARKLNRTVYMNLLPGSRIRLVIMPPMTTEVSEFFLEPANRAFSVEFNGDFA